MPQDFKTSFIPQKDLSEERKKGPSRVGVLYLIGVIIFVLSILLSGGVFAYKKVMERTLASKEESLEKAKEAFDPRLIEELSRMDKRIIAADELLNKHVVVSPLFEILENLTLQNVRFEEMLFEAYDKDKAVLQLSGQATSYASIVLQSEAFGNSRFLRDQIFSDFDLNQLGNVQFSFSANINPELIDYRGNLSDI